MKHLLPFAGMTAHRDYVPGRDRAWLVQTKDEIASAKFWLATRYAEFRFPDGSTSIATEAHAAS